MKKDYKHVDFSKPYIANYRGGYWCVARGYVDDHGIKHAPKTIYGVDGTIGSYWQFTPYASDVDFYDIEDVDNGLYDFGDDIIALVSIESKWESYVPGGRLHVNRIDINKDDNIKYLEKCTAENGKPVDFDTIESGDVIKNEDGKKEVVCLSSEDVNDLLRSKLKPAYERAMEEYRKEVKAKEDRDQRISTNKSKLSSRISGRKSRISDEDWFNKFDPEKRAEMLKKLRSMGESRCYRGQSLRESRLRRLRNR